MDLKPGEIVRSAAGHDKEQLFCIMREEGDFLWLADGKRRTVKTPKKKRRKHVVSMGLWTHPVTGRIAKGQPVLDSEVRRALAAFRDEGKFSEDRGGMTLG